MYAASVSGHTEVAQALIDAGANVNARTNMLTPLHFAAWKGHTQTARMLVAKGADHEELAQVDIESCGKSRVPLHGLVVQLHEDNLEHLYHVLREKEAAPA